MDRLRLRSARERALREARRQAWGQLLFAVVLLVVIVVGMELAYCWMDSWSVRCAAWPTP